MLYDKFEGHKVVYVFLKDFGGDIADPPILSSSAKTGTAL